MPPSVSPRFPDLSLEESLQGIIAGIDEAGRGPLAGPVVAACVILDRARVPRGINDSKALNSAERERIYNELVASAQIGIGFGSLKEIETYNILGATKLAMQKAVTKLVRQPDIALVDGNQLPDLSCNAIAVVGGDAKSLSIAAASIIAKVTRDRIMQKLAGKYTMYGWMNNAGYGTAEHRNAILQFGITPHHRKEFAPVKEFLENQREATL